MPGVADILPTTFNPPVCQVNRSNAGGQSIVHFRNKDTKPRHIIQPDIDPSFPPLFDEVIPAGATSIQSVGITAPTDRTFFDADDHSKSVKIISPVDPNAPSNCDQLPPTPTPTPTRTPTPIPTPTAIPTPRQVPPACTGLTPISRQPITGCAVAADVAKENPSETP